MALMRIMRVGAIFVFPAEKPCPGDAGEFVELGGDHGDVLRVLVLPRFPC